MANNTPRKMNKTLTYFANVNICCCRSSKADGLVFSVCFAIIRNWDDKRDAKSSKTLKIKIFATEKDTTNVSGARYLIRKAPTTSSKIFMRCEYYPAQIFQTANAKVIAKWVQLFHWQTMQSLCSNVYDIFLLLLFTLWSSFETEKAIKIAVS